MTAEVVLVLYGTLEPTEERLDDVPKKKPNKVWTFRTLSKSATVLFITVRITLLPTLKNQKGGCKNFYVLLNLRNFC